MAKKENIYNIPDAITFLRVIITFYIIYGAFAGFSLIHIAIAFCIGAITDFFDGVWARKFKETTEFGRKFDIIADRFLMISTVAVVLFLLFSKDLLSNGHIIQILIIMSREIITAPFAVVALIQRKTLPHAKLLGKATTMLQGFAFPAVVLEIFYPIFSFSIYLVWITFIVGIFSAIQYIKDWYLIEKGKKA